MLVSEAIDWLNKYHKPDETICMLLWTEDDVIDRAEELEIEITPDDARNILCMMYKYHDTSIGISWDTIDHWLFELG